MTKNTKKTIGNLLIGTAVLGVLDWSVRLSNAVTKDEMDILHPFDEETSKELSAISYNNPVERYTYALERAAKRDHIVYELNQKLRKRFKVIFKAGHEYTRLDDDGTIWLSVDTSYMRSTSVAIRKPTEEEVSEEVSRRIKKDFTTTKEEL